MQDHFKDAAALRMKIAENEQKIKQLQHQQQRIQNRIKDYVNAERKSRAHRLITKGAAIESIAPETKNIPEVEFYRLMESILTGPSVSKRIRQVAEKAGDGE